MPQKLSHPGVYVEEIPSGVRPIVGVSTSETAFVDWFPRGPVGKPVRVNSFEEFSREFGGLHPQSVASYAIYQYFLNGGAVAWVVRADFQVSNTATLTLLDAGSPPQGTLRVDAANPGEWGGRVQVAAVEIPDDPDRFNLFVREVAEGADKRVVAVEVHRGLSANTAAPDYMIDVVNAASRLVWLADVGTGTLPTLAAPTATGDAPDAAYVALTAVDDTAVLGPTGAALNAAGFRTALDTAMRTLDRIDPFVFNLLCIPAAATLDNEQAVLIEAAEKFCGDQRAFLLVDPPSGLADATAMRDWVLTDAGLTGREMANAAVYVPRVTVADPLAGGRAKDVGPSGAVAGIYARTDATRGVWKAPAGIDAGLSGVELGAALNDGDSGALNPFGINALRTFPVIGNVVWGARTLAGADQLASEWKYVPVRRMALYLEQSLVAGLTWVVFEPNGEPLWAQIRLNVGAFMQDLFRKGAFQGTTPRQAYLVRCDHTTTTQSDIDKGIVNILVGFAPLKPAEFVVIQIQQIAGQAAG